MDDLRIIQKNQLEIENFNFEKIIEKYSLSNSIIAIFFKNENEIKVLSKIRIKGNKVIKSNSFKNIYLDNNESIGKLINELKITYEDFWKENNLINTSIKFPILVKINDKNFDISLRFEKILNELDLVSSFSIISFDKDNVFYELIFNGTAKKFIDIMKEQEFNFDTQKKIWILK